MMDLCFREVYVALPICKLTLGKKKHGRAMRTVTVSKIGDLKTKVDGKFILFPMCIATL